MARLHYIHPRDDDDDVGEQPSKRSKLVHEPHNNINHSGDEQYEDDDDEEEAAAAAASPNWSDIPQDILQAVAGLMSIGDRIQASRVCKHWRYAITDAVMAAPASSYGYPCFLRLLDGNKTCALSDPLRKEHYLVDTSSCLLPDDVFIACSDYGWLLLVPYQYVPARALLFFNPLTRHIIELPKLRCTQKFAFCFSAPPTSPDCVVVGMFPFEIAGGTCFYYCRPGDEGWTSIHIPNGEDQRFKALRSKPFFFKDCVCVLDVSGRLGVFDVFNGKTLTKVTSELAHIRLQKKYGPVLNLGETDGKLLLVLANLHHRSINIYELDESKDQWVELQNLGDRQKLLFCSKTSCQFVKQPAAAASSGSGQVVVDDVFVYKRSRNNLFEIMSHSCTSNDNKLQPARFFDELGWNTCASAGWIELHK